MARKAPKLKVILSPRALTALDEIWEWNARRYNIDHADGYVAFLKSKAWKLATTFSRGLIVPTAPELRYVIIQRSRSGHGHVAVYKVGDTTIHVLDFYHTAQNWPDKFGGDE